MSLASRSSRRCAKPTAARSVSEYMHVHGAQREALVAAAAREQSRSKPSFHHAEQKKHILDRLTAAEGLERYLHTKYVGQKRFSLEGGESFIVSMDELVQRGR